MKREDLYLDHSLDFLKVWHAVFAKNLEYVVGNIQEDTGMTPVSIGNGGASQTGRWLAEQAPALHDIAAFHELVGAHARFHELAAEVATLHLASRRADLAELLGGRYAAASIAVDRAIDTLADELQARDFPVRRFSSTAGQSSSIWSESFETGIASIDREHHAIAVLIDQLLVNGSLDAGSEEARIFLEILGDLIRRDIEAENVQLRALQRNDVDCSAHLAAHAAIVDYLAEIAVRRAGLDLPPLDEIGRYLANWYIEHLVTFDLDL